MHAKELTTTRLMDNNMALLTKIPIFWCECSIVFFCKFKKQIWLFCINLAYRISVMPARYKACFVEDKGISNTVFLLMCVYHIMPKLDIMPSETLSEIITCRRLWFWTNDDATKWLCQLSFEVSFTCKISLSGPIKLTVCGCTINITD